MHSIKTDNVTEAVSAIFMSIYILTRMYKIQAKHHCLSYVPIFTPNNSEDASGVAIRLSIVFTLCDQEHS